MANLKRQPCAWCQERNRWPDRCGMDYPDPDGVCRDLTGDKCDLRDHRRCQPHHCAFARRWWRVIKDEGTRACGASGHTYAVVSVIDDVVTVHGTGDHLGRVKSLLRTRVAKTAGLSGPGAKGSVYVVRGADAEFF